MPKKLTPCVVHDKHAMRAGDLRKLSGELVIVIACKQDSGYVAGDEDFYDCAVLSCDGEWPCWLSCIETELVQATHKRGTIVP